MTLLLINLEQSVGQNRCFFIFGPHDLVLLSLILGADGKTVEAIGTTTMDQRDRNRA
jgi:hypothetical protein